MAHLGLSAPAGRRRGRSRRARQPTAVATTPDSGERDQDFAATRHCLAGTTDKNKIDAAATKPPMSTKTAQDATNSIQCQ